MNAQPPPLLLTEPETVAATPSPVGHVPHITVGTFSETAEVDAVIAEVALDRRLAHAITKTSMGGIPGAIAFCRANPTPDLLILEGVGSRDTLMAQLKELADYCELKTKVVVIGTSNDVALYRDLMDLGISDYVVGPVYILTLVATILRLLDKPGAIGTGRICAFIGAKGGVGASTIAQNLAWNIAQGQRRPVLLIDMDLQFGSVALNLNLESATCFADQLLGDGSNGNSVRLDQALFDRLLVPHGEFLSVLPGGNTTREVIEPAAEILSRLFDIAQNSFSLVVLDVPHSYSTWVKQALRAADDIILTAEPELGNLRNAKHFIEMLHILRPHDEPPRLVLNKVGTPARSEIKTTEFASALKLNVAATFGFDAKLFSNAANNGQMLSETSIKNTAKRPFSKLEQALTGSKDAASAKVGGLARLWRRLRH
ncbi:MAG: pilus assembly protein CpaE [Paracoccaceae bacterium]|jgi:pilus assembly protein CpaE